MLDFRSTRNVQALWNVYHLTTSWNLRRVKKQLLYNSLNLTWPLRVFSENNGSLSSTIGHNNHLSIKSIYMLTILYRNVTLECLWLWIRPCHVVLLCICEDHQDHGLGGIGCCRPFLNVIFVCCIFLSPALKIGIQYCQSKMQWKEYTWLHPPGGTGGRRGSPFCLFGRRRCLICALLVGAFCQVWITRQCASIVRLPCFP